VGLVVVPELYSGVLLRDSNYCTAPKQPTPAQPVDHKTDASPENLFAEKPPLFTIS